MKRILFVDDEAMILDSLKRMLRGQRKEWEMAFVDGGEAALKEMAKNEFDVIVTDMRMPGMDGAELLDRVQALYPSTVRIVLSGHSDLEACVRAARVAHQFLGKPCDPEVIREVVIRACNTHSLLDGTDLKKTLGAVQSLPAVPRVYSQLVDAMTDEDVGIGDVASIVEQDIGISAKLLQLVNSSFFGVAKAIADIRQAASHLGMNMIRDLTLSTEVLSAFSNKKLPSGFSLDQEHAQSMLAARIAKRIPENKRDSEDAFLAAALHHIGKLIIATELTDQYPLITKACNEQNLCEVEAEKSVLGVSHARIGAYLLGVWGMPFTIVEAVAYHHRPADVEQTKFGVLGAVHVASLFAEELKPTERGSSSNPTTSIDEDYLRSMGVLDSLPAWRAIAEEEAEDQIEEAA